jgi:hypothetical protein
LSWGNDAAGWRTGDATPGDFGSTPGDFNGDGQVDLRDVDILSAGLRTGDPQFDVDADGSVDSADLIYLVETILGSRQGDANLDGIFNSADLVQVFQRGEYEDNVADNSTWSEGDWDGDGEFTSGDFVAALSAGPYSLASVPAVPTSYALLSDDRFRPDPEPPPLDSPARDEEVASPIVTRAAAPSLELVARDLLFDVLARRDTDKKSVAEAPDSSPLDIPNSAPLRLRG